MTRLPLRVVSRSIALSDTQVHNITITVPVDARTKHRSLKNVAPRLRGLLDLTVSEFPDSTAITVANIPSLYADRAPVLKHNETQRLPVSVQAGSLTMPRADTAAESESDCSLSVVCDGGATSHTRRL